MGAFKLEVSEKIATLIFDLPEKKVNIFSRDVLKELEELVAELAKRNDIKVLVLTSAKKDVFIAGADIGEIEKLEDPVIAEGASRRGQQLFSSWESLPFPTVAAIDGVCMGGGTELALACTYRVISNSPKAKMALPEVKLGILPAWGGCVRLPRTVGLEVALDMILTGRSVAGRKAKRVGLVDEVIPRASFYTDLYKFIEKLPKKREKKAGLRKLILEGNPLGRRLVFDQARKNVLEKTKGHYPAPLRAVEVIRIGVEEGIAAGFEAEARALGELAVSPITKNLIHVFRLSELGKKIGGYSDVKSVDLTGVAVVGAGVMGGGIAHAVVSRANLPVRLKDISQEALTKAIKTAAKLIEKQVKRKRISEPEAKRQLALIRPTLSNRGFKRCNLMVEAVIEDMGIKKKVFEEFEKLLPEDSVLGTNTSALDIEEIASVCKDPGKVIGIHFFNPVDKMPLVEIVTTSKTSKVAVNTALDFTKRLGKTPVVVKNTPGFLVNRLLITTLAEALWVFYEGFPITEVDKTMEEWGMPMGPYTLSDAVGIDVAFKVAKYLASKYPDRIVLPGFIDEMLANKFLGTKVGKGFYVYKGNKKKEVNQILYDALGIKVRENIWEITFIVDRLVLPMVNEAARVLAEGVVTSADELDLAMIFGTGFPPFRGGLLKWADAFGLTLVIDRLEDLSKTIHPRFKPSKELLEVANKGGFYSLYGYEKSN